MKNVIGSPASGEDYFDRPIIEKRVWEALSNKCNVLISSPRRVGKTSLLFHMVDTADNSFYPLYVITQSVGTRNDFFKRLFNAVVAGASIKSSLKISKRSKELLRAAIGKIKVIKVSQFGLELNGSEPPDYFAEFLDLLEHLNLDGSTLVIMVDEITQTLENIIRKEGEVKAIEFMEQLRELRLNEEIRTKILFIYTGSIGLEGIMDRLGYADLINDLHPVKFPSLTRNEARKFVSALLKNPENLGCSISDAEIEYLFDRIEWLIIHYIKIALQAIKDTVVDKELTIVLRDTIDLALDHLLEHRNHFEHWKTRLRKSFKKNDFKFAMGLLAHAAENAGITTNEILNLAWKYKVEDQYKSIINDLVYDGYINNDIDRACYRFNSPILKAWWYKNVTN